MFRAALLSIVLTLAAGPSAALFCGVYHSSERMAGACEHQTHTAPSGIVASDDCAVNSNPTVFVREDGRRHSSAPDVTGAVGVATFAFTPPAAGILSVYDPDSRLLLALRPLVFALRI